MARIVKAIEHPESGIAVPFKLEITEEDINYLDIAFHTAVPLSNTQLRDLSESGQTALTDEQIQEIHLELFPTMSSAESTSNVRLHRFRA